MVTDKDEKIFFLHNEQIEKIAEYVRLTNKTPPNREDGFQEFHDKTLNYLRIIECFDNDPVKAATHWNNAIEKADEEMGKVYDEMLAHMRKPTKIYFYDYFESAEEAEEYKELISQKGRAAFSETMNKEFYSRLDAYLSKINEDTHYT
jgi:vacuolar-type H+-ATPase subunit H